MKKAKKLTKREKYIFKEGLRIGTEGMFDFALLEGSTNLFCILGGYEQKVRNAKQDMDDFVARKMEEYGL